MVWVEFKRSQLVTQLVTPTYKFLAKAIRWHDDWYASTLDYHSAF